MRYLLDTHVLLWMRENDHRLNREKWENAWMDEANQVYFSMVSLWEIAIKTNLGKLKIEVSLTEFSDCLRQNFGFHILPIEVAHVEKLFLLPRHHNDPFDRLLIAQAQAENLLAITNDSLWKRYDVSIDW